MKTFQIGFNTKSLSGQPLFQTVVAHLLVQDGKDRVHLFDESLKHAATLHFTSGITAIREVDATGEVVR